MRGVDITSPKTWRRARRKKDVKRSDRAVGKGADRLVKEWKPKRQPGVYGSTAWKSDITDPKVWRKSRRRKKR